MSPKTEIKETRQRMRKRLTKHHQHRYRIAFYHFNVNVIVSKNGVIPVFSHRDANNRAHERSKEHSVCVCVYDWIHGYKRKTVHIKCYFIQNSFTWFKIHSGTALVLHIWRHEIDMECRNKNKNYVNSIKSIYRDSLAKESDIAESNRARSIFDA